MSAATQIATKDLRLRLRDRSAIVIGVIAPLALAFIFDLVFGVAFDEQSFDLEYGLVDMDGSQISQGFEDTLLLIQAEGVFQLETFAGRDSATAAVDNGEIDAYFLVPAGMGADIVAGEETTIEIVGDVDASTGTQIAASIADGFGEHVAASQLSVATAALTSPSPPSPAAFGLWAQEAAIAEPNYVLEDISAATKQLDGATYFAAGMAVFFLFFTVQFGVSGLLEEQREGTLARLLAAPIRKTAVIVGKALLSFLLGVISMTILIVATHFLMGAEWGAPLGVAILVITGVLSATGIMGLVAAIAKTPEGAGNIGSIIAVILAMFGGVFFQVGQGDDLLSKLSLLTPHQWFLRGLAELTDGAAWTAALPSAGAMLVFALATGAVGWFAMKRRLAA